MFPEFPIDVLGSPYVLFSHFSSLKNSVSSNSCIGFSHSCHITNYTLFFTLLLTRCAFFLHSLCRSQIFVGIIFKSVNSFCLAFSIFFHFAPLLLPLPPLMSFHIFSSSSGRLPSSLCPLLSLLHTPDALLLAPVCPKGLIDSER